ncbi:MAG: DivIVA domain-containing protein [Propionibacteriaceae bacterium]|jgi:DivIVA domain-containing protein|nr:DivIVA domain-containing protein [Propionibacteriaceae bacterium]
MEWFIAGLAVAVLGLAAVAASGGLGQLGPLKVDRRPLELPAGPLTADDLAAVRFEVVPRGYSMDQVDQLMHRLVAELGGAPTGTESGIMEEKGLSDRRNHDGSDETAHG